MKLQIYVPLLAFLGSILDGNIESNQGGSPRLIALRSKVIADKP